ncbi:MAG: hypothetical protein RLZZ135_1701, partial [Cyanobacteriota bacterium]
KDAEALAAYQHLSVHNADRSTASVDL